LRYNVEHQRNIAYDLLELDRKDIRLANALCPGEPVAIYGFDFIGKEVYERIKLDVDVICFFDRAYDGAIYDGVPVYSLENEEVLKLGDSLKTLKVIIIIMSDFDKIVTDVLNRIKIAEPISVYKILAFCKVKFDKEFIENENSTTLELLYDIIRDKPVKIDNIILVGTAYTQLLGILYLKNWKNSLFIMERYISENIANRIKDNQLCCLYEKEAVQCYSLCYIIAEYVKKHSISIWGHDHMQLSRPFLNSAINILEDGLGNYDFIYTKQYNIILDNGEFYIPLGYDAKIKKVILTGQFDLPKEIKEKIICVNPTNLWKQKNKDEKKMITQIFGFPYETIVSEEREKTILFLTEPNIDLSSEIQSKDEQIRIYKEIISKYPGSKVIIKPHPADIINYAKELPECVTIEKSFPIQMIAWFGIKFFKVIIMHGSSCLNIFQNIYNVDVYDGTLLLNE